MDAIVIDRIKCKQFLLFIIQMSNVLIYSSFVLFYSSRKMQPLVMLYAIINRTFIYSD